MNQIHRRAGIGLIAYAVCTAAAFFGSGAPGGDYSASSVANYIASANLPLIATLWGIAAVGALGLLVVADGLRTQPRSGPLLVGLATAGAAVSVAGAFVSGGVAIAMAEGGAAVREGVPPAVVYTITEIGNLLAVCAPALCVGVAAIVMAVRSALPGWLRVISVPAGICGILAPLFVTYFVFLLWALLAGTAIAVRRTAAPALEAAPSMV